MWVVLLRGLEEEVSRAHQFLILGLLTAEAA